MVVKKGVEDELLVAKLFLQIHRKPVEAKSHQISNRQPNVVDVERLHRSLLQLVTKSDVLKKCESPVALLQIDFLDKSIYLKLKDIHFGFSMEGGPKNLKQQEVCSTNIKAIKKLLGSFLLSKRYQKKGL